MSASRMIAIKDVTKIFHPGTPAQSRALNGVTFDVAPNELLILKGPSGSGKSTLLSLIAALMKPTSGEVVVDGTRVSKLPEEFAALYRRRTIGFVFQKFNLIPTLSAVENVMTPLFPEKIPEAELEAKALGVMEEFSIAHKRNAKTSNLSGGEQQRVAIARALVNDPPILLADEPTANLDAALSRQFLGFIERIKEEGKTIIVATHDPLFFDLSFCDRQIELHDGSIVAEEP
ncbi:ABC transporter ATP-binding protein [Hydrogenimonas sp.]